MSFFKAYDMRGTFGTDFDLETVYRVGRALPTVVPGNRWLVGRDCRETSEAVRDALVRGLLDAGVTVKDIGLCTTPMVYFFTAVDGYDGSVMVTASHNPPTDNGLKVSMRGALPVGYANGLNRVEELCGQELQAKNGGEALMPWCATVGDDALPRYLAWMRRNNAPIPYFLKFAVDCSNGMASLLAHELFPDAVIINDTLDGRFPNHSPNPLKSEAREQLSAIVREQGLDFGVIFDGDADRCMFVDERGEFVQPDYLIPVVARATIRRSEALVAMIWGNEMAERCWSGRIVHDVRTSRGAIEEIRRMGCEPLMCPVGHAFAKPVMRESGAMCGGELAGHYYFSELHSCDSGILAALRIISEISRAKSERKTFSEMMRPISGVYENSGELNFKVEDKDAAIARVLDAAKTKLPPEIARSEIDGIRLEYDEGWVNIRKSNTEPYLRMIVERRRGVDEWVSILKGAIGEG